MPDHFSRDQAEAICGPSRHKGDNVTAGGDPMPEAERRFERFTYDELITLAHGIGSMVGIGSAARWLHDEIDHEMHCKRHESAGKPIPVAGSGEGE